MEITFGYVSGNPVLLTDPFGLAPPQGIPPNANISANVRLSEGLNITGFFGATTFYAAVRNKGPWDYKQQGAQFQDFGNYNFGVAGRALGFSENVLLRMAGWAQTRAKTSDPSWGSPLGKAPFGDDPNDQKWIQEGIDDYDSCNQNGGFWDDGQSCRN